MSTPPAAPAAPAEPAAPATDPLGATPAAPATPAQEPTDWKAESRKWEARAKANTDAAERLAAIEEASKSEAQKAIDRAEKAERALAERENAEALARDRDEVSKATGVPAAALRGNTKEEFEAHAAELKPLITTPGPVVPRQGDTPQHPVSDAGAFVRGLFGGTTS